MASGKYVVVAGINGPKWQANRWGVGVRHQGAGYADLYKVFPPEDLLTLSPYGPGFASGAINVDEATADGGELLWAVRNMYMPSVRDLVRQDPTVAIHLVCHSGGGLPGLMLAHRVVHELHLNVTTICLVETPRTGIDGLEQVDKSETIKIQFDSGLKQFLHGFNPDYHFPGTHEGGLAGLAFLALIAAVSFGTKRPVVGSVATVTTSAHIGGPVGDGPPVTPRRRRKRG